MILVSVPSGCSWHDTQPRNSKPRERARIHKDNLVSFRVCGLYDRQENHNSYSAAFSAQHCHILSISRKYAIVSRYSMRNAQEEGGPTATLVPQSCANFYATSTLLYGELPFVSEASTHSMSLVGSESARPGEQKRITADHKESLDARQTNNPSHIID